MTETKKRSELEPADLNLYQKLAAITGEVGAIAKGGRNAQQNFNFIEYAAVAGELRGLFAKYGVIIVPRMAQQTNQKRLVNGKAVSVLIDFTYTIINADKPDEKFTVTWTGEAIDYGDKATNKAATSALKYYLMRQFNISEKGEDPDAESPQAVAPVKKPARPSRAPASTEEPGIDQTPPPEYQEEAASTREPDVAFAPATALQMRRITALLRGQGVKDENMKAVLASAYGVERSSMSRDDAEGVIDELQNGSIEVES